MTTALKNNAANENNPKWENIIKKVNQKEGGLSELFSDCKDEKGLTEKWLLDAVEKKLDPSGEKTGNFGKIIKHHAVQCYENEDKIRRRLFQGEGGTGR